jgi:hypothetical protein
VEPDWIFAFGEHPTGAQALGKLGELGGCAFGSVGGGLEPGLYCLEQLSQLRAKIRRENAGENCIPHQVEQVVFREV